MKWQKTHIHNKTELYFHWDHILTSQSIILCRNQNVIQKPLSLNTRGFLTCFVKFDGGPGSGTGAPAVLALVVLSTGGPLPRPDGLMWSYLKKRHGKLS